MTEAVVVSTTLDDETTARAFAGRLVEQRLAACVQIVGPITSTYRWEGRVEHAQEWLLLVKTTGDGYPAVAQFLREEHPYDVPEVLATPIVAGSSAYLSWLRDQVGDQAG